MTNFSYFQDASLRKKLVFLSMLSSGFALTLACCGILAHAYISARGNVTNDITELGEFVAQSTTAALAFNQKNNARENLAIFEFKKNVRAAGIYNENGTLFATYTRSDVETTFPPHPKPKSTRFHGDRLLIFLPITHKGDSIVLGTLFIEADLGTNYTKIANYLKIFLVIFPFAFLISLLFSSVLQMRISKPITELTNIATRVSREKNYAIRAYKSSNDEVGQLIACFNDMLTQIQKRDKQLQEANELLERRVEERVEELKREIAERRQLEERERKLQQKLARSERMESLGILAGGVAHDLNNILGPLVGYPDLIIEQLPADSPVIRELETIRDTAKRAAAVIQDLLTLARRSSYKLQVISLNEVIRNYCNSPDFEERITRSNKIKLRISLDEQPLAMQGSTPHLSQVIMNLVHNAIDAMPRGGILKIKTSFEYLPTKMHAFNGTMPAGYYATCTVSDTGLGMREEDVERIFEPFYTQKELGKSGTGLGLAVVYGVICDLKGYISVKTSPGRGSTFKVYFPAESPEAIPTKEKNTPINGNESILIIDDDASQRQLGKKLLSHLGYRVTTCENGRKALSLLRHNHYDLIILDMIMEPEFDGLDTYRAIRALDIHVPCMIASGFSENDRVKTALRLGAALYIRKPYSLMEIGRAVRQALATSPAAQKQAPARYSVSVAGTSIRPSGGKKPEN